MNCFNFGCLLTSVVLSFHHGSVMSCNISTAYVTRVGPKECGLTAELKISQDCLFSLETIKVTERNIQFCTIKYTRGQCAQQTGCTCGVSPHRFTVTQYYKVTKSVRWDVSARLTNGTFISKRINAFSKCKKTETDNAGNESLSTDTSRDKKSNFAFVTVGVSTSIALVVIVVCATYIICHRRSSHAGVSVNSFAMSAPQEAPVQQAGRPSPRQERESDDAASVMHNNSFYASRSLFGEYSDVRDKIKATRVASRIYSEGGRVYDEIDDSDSGEEGAVGGQAMYVDPEDVKKKKQELKKPGVRPMTRK